MAEFNSERSQSGIEDFDSVVNTSLQDKHLATLRMVEDEV